MFIVTISLSKFVKDLVNAIQKISISESLEFDPTTVAVLAMCLEEKGIPGKHGGKYLGARYLSGKLNIGHNTVIKRLNLLSRYGILNVYCVWSAESRHFLPMEIILNKQVLNVVEKPCSQVQLTALCSRLAKLGIARGDYCEALQGFTSHVKYGEVEKMRVLDSETLARLPKEERDLFGEALKEATKSNSTQEAKAQAKRERMEKMAMAHSFVRGCADLWCKGQVKAGRMNPTKLILPNWYAEDLKQLSPITKREYQELVQAFLRYGGIRTAIAWMFFNAIEPIMDEKYKDKPKFILSKPFQQWVSSDKKPSSFIKHLNALFLDEVFQSGLADEMYQNRIRELFDAKVCAYRGELAEVAEEVAERVADGVAENDSNV